MGGRGTSLFERTKNGGSLKMTLLLGEYTRQSLALRVERQMTSTQVLKMLWWAMMTYGIPVHFRSDNGPKFIAQKVQNGSKKIYIEPGIAGKMATSSASTPGGSSHPPRTF